MNAYNQRRHDRLTEAGIGVADIASAEMSYDGEGSSNCVLCDHDIVHCFTLAFPTATFAPVGSNCITNWIDALPQDDPSVKIARSKLDAAERNKRELVAEKKRKIAAAERRAQTIASISNHIERKLAERFEKLPTAYVDNVCADLMNKLLRYGGFVSEKQRNFFSVKVSQAEKAATAAASPKPVVSPVKQEALALTTSVPAAATNALVPATEASAEVVVAPPPSPPPSPPPPATSNVTPEQQAFIDHEYGPALALAVAGSGKTTSGALRCKALIEKGLARPEEILFTTFSNRGAKDMAERAESLGVPKGVEYRTLHSVAYELLRGLKTTREPSVPEKWKVMRVIKDALARLNVKPNDKNGVKPSLILSEIGLAKAALVWPDRSGKPGEWVSSGGVRFQPYVKYAASRARNPIPVDTAMIVEACYVALEDCAEAPEEYSLGPGNRPFEKDAGKRWVTFDDMLAIVAKNILQGARWTERHRGRYKIVMVDEVQDNNLAQWALVEHLARNNNIVAIGDDQQNIYNFRGADLKLMREFKDRHPDLKVYPLSLNFRCGDEILKAANGVLGYAKDRLYDGNLKRGRGPEAVGKVAATEYASSVEEAERVVNEIKILIDGGRKPSDITVLARLNAGLGLTEVECIKAGINYKIAGTAFFNQGIVRSAIGYLGCALDEQDAESFKACYGVPTRYLGNVFLEACPTLASAKSNLGNPNMKRWHRGMRDLIDAIDKVKSVLTGTGDPSKFGLVSALSFIFDDIGVHKHYQDDGASEDDETEVDTAMSALIGCAATLQKRHTDQLQAVRDLLAYARSQNGKEDHEGDDQGEVSRVTLSTVHKYKGLEAPVVFLVGVQEGVFPFVKGFEDEERRLGYVALTRARDVLSVSWAFDKSAKYPGGPSSIVREAGLLKEDSSNEAVSR